MRPKVLVVDDDRVIAQITEVWLRHAGFEVAVAYDGQGALAAAATVGPDAILLDIRMPRVDGWDVMRALKSDPVLARVPVIVFSAHVQETTRQRALESGACLFLSKPFEPAELLGAVRAALWSGPSTRSPVNPAREEAA